MDMDGGFSEEALEAGRVLFAGPVEFVKGVVDLKGLPPADRAEVCFDGDCRFQLESARQLCSHLADDQIAFLVRHFGLMVEQHQEYSCLMFRKFAAWYGVRLGIPEDLEDRLRRFESFDEFDAIVEQIRQRHGTRQGEVATALVKVPNGPVERW